MTDRYLDFTAGNDANAGTIGSPWQNPLKANASATSGDTVYFAAGQYLSTAYTGAPTSHVFTNPLILTSSISNAASMTSTDATFVFRISGSMASGSTFTVDGIASDGTGHTHIFQVGDMKAVATVKNATWTGITASGVNDAATGGTVTIQNMTFTGGGQTAGTNLAAIRGPNTYGAVVSSIKNLVITDVTVNLSAPADNQASSAVSAISATTRLSAFNFTATRVAFNVTGHASNVVRGFDVEGSDGATFTAISGVVTSTSSSSCAGIYMKGRGASATMNNIVVDGQGKEIYFNAPAGYCISHGDSTGSNFMTGGVIKGQNGRGTYYASSTPHGCMIGQGNNAVVSSVSMRDFYACFLLSITAAGATMQNVTAIDPYGVGLYAKGCVAGSYLGCNVYITGKWTQRNLAALHVDSQSGTNTTTVTYEGCLVIWGTTNAALLTKLFAVRVNSTAIFNNCTFIIPDTFSAGTALAEVGCTSEGSLGGGTTYTAAQIETGWTAVANGTGTTTVSNCKVVQMPITKILPMIYGPPGYSQSSITRQIANLI